jgi:hypothetical protein
MEFGGESAARVAIEINAAGHLPSFLFHKAPGHGSSPAVDDDTLIEGRCRGFPTDDRFILQIAHYRRCAKEGIERIVNNFIVEFEQSECK